MFTVNILPSVFLWVVWKKLEVVSSKFLTSDLLKASLFMVEQIEISTLKSKTYFEINWGLRVLFKFLLYLFSGLAVVWRFCCFYYVH